MDKSMEALKTLNLTLEKYKKNKTQVSEEDLMGRYRIPFERLKNSLWDILSEYVVQVVFKEIKIIPADKEMFIRKFTKLYREYGYPERFTAAAYERYNLQEIQSIASELKQNVLDLSKQYWQEVHNAT